MFRALTGVVIVSWSLALVGYGYDYDSSDFAMWVIDYDNSQSATWNDPQTVLGRPAVDTDGDFSMFEDRVAVLPVFAPWTPEDVYRVGEGTSITVMFDHPVEDDPLNPCGVDFIVFGNAILRIGEGVYWDNSDPNQTTLQVAELFEEPGIVSVSQDNVVWHTFSVPPLDPSWRADTFAPTLGRIYDPQHPDPSLDYNFWWGQPTNPTYPLNPNLTPQSFYDPGQGVACTVAQVAMKYGYSAGGTGFDLSDLDPPLDWIQYIRIDYSPEVGLSPEIDAIADVAPVVLPDLDCDSDVDGEDRALFDPCRSGANVHYAGGCERADFDQDGDVDQSDFGLLQRCFTGPDRLLDWNCMD